MRAPRRPTGTVPLCWSARVLKPAQQMCSHLHKNLWIVRQRVQFCTVLFDGFSENRRDRPSRQGTGPSIQPSTADLSGASKLHRTSVERKESKCAFMMCRPCETRCSIQVTRARCATPRPHWPRLSPTLCTPISRFTDISVTGADPSSPWWCGAARKLPALQRARLVCDGGADREHSDRLPAPGRTPIPACCGEQRRGRNRCPPPRAIAASSATRRPKPPKPQSPARSSIFNFDDRSHCSLQIKWRRYT